MRETTNYRLLKPDYTDVVDVEILNDNSDIIDSTLAAKANLVGGKVPASELPSYVDDVIEGYYYNGAFYEESAHTTTITPETGKIYIDLSSENCYRWSGSVYVQISSPESPIVEGYYYNGTFYEESAHTTAITPETGKIYIDLSTNDCYRWSGAAYELLSTPESEIYWATYDTTLDAAGIQAAYDDMSAAHAAGQLIVCWPSQTCFYCVKHINTSVTKAFYFVAVDQTLSADILELDRTGGWSSQSLGTLATQGYVNTAISQAGNLPQGSFDGDIPYWDGNTHAWLTGGLANAATFDATPTQNSLNPVTSGGIYSALQNVSGWVAQSSAPSNTSLLWIDTDDNTVETYIDADTESFPMGVS